MADVLDTRSRIKTAAMRLFAERGVEAVTVREIVAASEAKNAGSLNYYFNSKEELITELLTDIYRVSNEDWLDGLTALQLRGGPKSVRDIIHIIVYAPTPHFREGTAHRFVASLLFTRRKMVSEFLEKMNFMVFGRLLRYIRELTPHISEAVMNQRLIFLLQYLVSVQASIEAGTEDRKGSHIWTDTDVLANLENTAVALIEAPQADAASDAKITKRAQRMAKPKLKSRPKSEPTLEQKRRIAK